jgi:hypothetical protein
MTLIDGVALLCFILGLYMWFKILLLFSEIGLIVIIYYNKQLSYGA